MRYHSICDKHKKGIWYIPKSDRRDDCPKCQSNNSSDHSDLVTRAHVFGIGCKEKNQCRVCCEIRHITRVLRHCGGTCSSKKCPVCEWGRHQAQKGMVGFYTAERRERFLIRKLYKLMLGRKK